MRPRDNSSTRTIPRAVRKQPKDKLRRPVPTIAPTARPRTPDSLRLFRNNNTKLSANIFSWSIPAITTCPGATTACLAVCYATKGFFKMPDVKAHYARNLERTKDEAFVRDAIEEIHERKIRVLRVHVAGDFYDAAYITKWCQITLACPETKFFVYTRSWRIAGFQPALRRLARIPNVQLWLSEDSASGRSPRIKDTRVAYMAIGPEEEANVPRHADLVFRDAEGVPAKQLNGCRVCPYEQNVPRKIGKIGCDRCGICYNPPRQRSQSPLTSMDFPDVVPLTLPVLNPAS